MVEITKPGIYENMPANIYHSDPCPTPSLSNSLIRDLIDKSPLHAAYKHPKLYKTKEENPSSAMIRGTVLHKLILGNGQELSVIYADDYRTKAAKELRDQALSENKIPVLEKDFQEIRNCSDVAMQKMANHPACEGFFYKGRSEIALAWQERDIWCRAMIDRLPDDDAYPIFDIKGTDLSASPFDWEKRLSNIYRTQGAFYNRGLQKLGFKKRETIRFVVIEMFEPFEICVFSLTEELEKIAVNEVERAIKIWRHSLNNNDWHGYPQEIVSVFPKPWLEHKVMDQKTIEEERGLYQ